MESHRRSETEPGASPRTGLQGDSKLSPGMSEGFSSKAESNTRVTRETIVAVYYNAVHAEAAVASLMAAGLPADAIGLHAGHADTPSSFSAAHRGSWSNPLRQASTAGLEEQDQICVTVQVCDADINRVMDILESHYPIDVDEQRDGIAVG